MLLQRARYTANYRAHLRIFNNIPVTHSAHYALDYVRGLLLQW